MMPLSEVHISMTEVTVSSPSLTHLQLWLRAYEMLSLKAKVHIAATSLVLG